VWPSVVATNPGFGEHQQKTDRLIPLLRRCVGVVYGWDMEYRTLGRSGCAVSHLCLGTMTFGTETDEAGSHARLDRFVEVGGSLVDTADVYSGGASEEVIGRWFVDHPSDVTDRVVLATEGRFPTGEAPNDLGLSARHLTRALDRPPTRSRA
jgi:aryl-alcohol dehydrogenase-like predicted oxidoreductase